MSLEALLFSLLTGAAPIAALVAQRVFPDVAPQDAEDPLLVVTVVDRVPELTLAGAPENTLSNARVQIDAYAKTRAEASALATAVVNTFGKMRKPTHGADVWATSPGRNLFDDETQSYRVLMEFNVWR
ncbi:MAG: hypothetical protein DI536_28895 [Archangium gephyra]|uniref:DUF3168 domain-containing protein n=1 Tax=Archangium gephyra TaxID=48 RepID=A0A2W5T4I2_9BACT|nr:MAG: hypothetical protein DI536_28895 [Archangium gephyra]